jgi:presenilin-like A22 family membrane protease
VVAFGATRFRRSVGIAVLLLAVKQGKPQAGLPPLNAGTIAGFLIGCALAGAWGWV